MTPLHGRPVQVMAHRGGRGLWPENTLFAFRSALERGADVLETDLRLTKDGILVIHHDATVDATSDGSGSVRDIVLADLRALDFGHRFTPDGGASFPYRGKGLGIATLDEALDAFPDARFNFDLKDDDTTAVRLFCEAVDRHGARARVLAASFHGGTLKRVRRACPGLATAAGFGESLTFYLASCAGLSGLFVPPARAFQVPPKLSVLRPMSGSFIAAAHRAGLEVHFWTLNDPADMRRAIDLGADGIITDYPDRLLHLVGH